MCVCVCVYLCAISVLMQGGIWGGDGIKSHTSNDRAELQGGGSGTLKQLDRDSASIGRDVVPSQLVAAAGGHDLVLCGRGDGIKAGSLGVCGRDDGQEGSGGDCELHFEKFWYDLFEYYDCRLVRGRRAVWTDI